MIQPGPDGPASAAQVSANIERIREFSWDRVGEQYIEAFERLVA